MQQSVVMFVTQCVLSNQCTRSEAHVAELYGYTLVLRAIRMEQTVVETPATVKLLVFHGLICQCKYIQSHCINKFALFERIFIIIWSLMCSIKVIFSILLSR